MPYPSDGRAFLNDESTRATSCGGAGAPPPPTDTSDDVSRFENDGDSSRSHDWVGTPTKLVMRSCSMCSRARSGSHLYMITSLMPAEKQLSITGTHPVTWNNGTMRMNAGGSVGAAGGGPSVFDAARVRSMAVRQPNAVSAWHTERWVDTAPLGRPVVPDV